MRCRWAGAWLATAVLVGCGGQGGGTVADGAGGSRTDGAVREDAVPSRRGADAWDGPGTPDADTVDPAVPDVRPLGDTSRARDASGPGRLRDARSVADASRGDAAAGGVDTASGDGAAGEPDTASASACDIESLGDLWKSTFASYTGPCSACHNANVSPGQLKAPGPQWLVPGDAEGTVERIESFGLLDPDDPLRSLLLLKPLARADGGVKHTGGDLVFGSTPAYEALVDFVQVAAPCAGAAP